MKLKKLLILVLITLNHSVFAQTELTSPQSISLPGSEIPGFGTEALHKIRFTIKADGSIEDAEIIGGFTTPFAEQFIIQSTNNWTFKPGTENGTPVDFYNQEFIIRANLSEEHAISSEIEETLQEVSELTSEEKYDRAVRLLNRTIKNDLITIFDYALTHEVLSSVYMSMNDPFSALAASKISTMSRTSSAGDTEFILPPEILEAALRKRFLLAASLSQNVEAAKTFNILKENFDIASDDPIIAQAEQAESLIASPEPLGLLAKITDKVWTYEPTRRIFTVINVDGTLRNINVRCERRNLELDFEEGVEWTLPAALGKCALDFQGRDNTQFAVYEFSE